MKTLAAKLSILALLVAGTVHAAVIEETGHASPGMSGAAAPLGAGADRAMRTTKSLNAIQIAFDTSDPGDNIAIFPYNRKTIYKLRLREFMTTTVVLPKGEAIDAYTLGDSENFSFIPLAPKDKKAVIERLDNIFSIRPTYPGADTSLTIIGKSGRVYSFYMRADSVKSTYMPIFTAFIEDRGAGFMQPDKSGESASEGDAPAAPEAAAKPEKMTGEAAAAEAEYLRSLPVVDPSKINLNGYKVAGGDLKAPIKVFDDGYWTYFKLSEEKNLDKARAPAIYRVVDGYDTPVNVRVEGGTIIAEAISAGWTLRAGEAHLCIRAKK